MGAGGFFVHTLLWIGFVVLILGLLAVDLFLVNRKAHEVTMRQAFAWTAVFALLGASFAGAVYGLYSRDVGGMGSRFVVAEGRAEGVDGGREGASEGAGSAVAAAAEAFKASPEQLRDAGADAAVLYLSGWLVEYALSMDNIFVMALIFGHFRVPAKYQHRVLFWGIMGALVLRGVMIGVGAGLVHRFEWVLYLFGIFLLVMAVKMLRSDDKPLNPEQTLVYRLASRFFTLTPRFHGQAFFAVENGVRMATPLFLVLLIIEGTDVVFAVDSIPAIFSVTQDPFLVFTSNVFAILGLRSLYFALAGAMGKFHYLKVSLALVLAFVGGKMLLEGVHQLHALDRMLPKAVSWLTSWAPNEQIHVPAPWSLGTIAALLTLGIVASLVIRREEAEGRGGGEVGGGDGGAGGGENDSKTG